MRKRLQILLVLTVMLAVLIGSGVFIKLSQSYLTRHISEQIIEDNRTIGLSILEYLNQSHLRNQSADVQRALLQEMCDRIILPNGGYVCAADRGGNLVAFPGILPDDPYMNITMSSLTNFQDLVMSFSELPVDDFSSGIYQKGEEQSLTAVLPIDNSDLRLFVHQDLHEVSRSVQATVVPLYAVGFLLTLIVGLFSLLISNRLVHRYEHKLELVNAELEHSNSSLSEALRERELFYQAFHHVQHSVAITDSIGQVLYVNPAFEDMYGYTHAEMENESLTKLLPGKTQCRDLGIGEDQLLDMHHALVGGTHDVPKSIATTPHRCCNDEIIWVDAFTTCLNGSDGRIANRINISIDVSERRADENEVRYEIYKALAELAETRDNETGAHVMRVSRYSRWIAEELGMPKKFCDDIEMFTPLHDIGKVGIPDEVLLAPRKLSDDEFAIMQTHSELGYKILAGRKTLEMATDICRSHHEKFNGEGYPQGIAGEEIPLAARIVAVADVYDALRSKRHYKDAWSHERAKETIAGDSHTHFDPAVVQAFIQLHERFKLFSEQHADKVLEDSSIQP